jgi:hypothetical protein
MLCYPIRTQWTPGKNKKKGKKKIRKKEKKKKGKKEKEKNDARGSVVRRRAR